MSQNAAKNVRQTDIIIGMKGRAMAQSSNLSFLAQHSQLLADLDATGERLFPSDPASCVIKLRILVESLRQEMATRKEL